MTSSGSIYRIYSTAEYITPNPAPESLYVTQITGLYHPLITLHITVTEQPKIKVASRAVVCPRSSPPSPSPHTPQVAMSEQRKKTVKKRLFSRAKVHWNAESCLFSTQLTVTANVRNVTLLKFGRSDTCDAENSATIALPGLSHRSLHPLSCCDTVLSVHRPIHRTDRRYSRDARWYSVRVTGKPGTLRKGRVVGF